MAMIPGTFPANVLLILILLPPECLSVLTSTVVIAPVTVAFFCIPVPVTVTSSNTLLWLGSILMFMTWRSLIGISCLS